MSADGEILALAPIAVPPNAYPSALRVNAAGQLVAVFLLGNSALITVYSRELKLAWQTTLAEQYPHQSGTPIDISPSGEVVVFTRSAAGALRYFESSGQLRWQWPTMMTSVFEARFVDGGDILAFADTGMLAPPGPHRIRFSGASGAIIADKPIAATPQLVLADGGFVVAGYTQSEPNTAVRRFDASAELVWERTFDTRSFNNPVLATTGDVVAQTSYGENLTSYRLMILDGGSGASREISMNSHLTVLGAEAERYFALGLTGSTSVGLARFAIP